MKLTETALLHGYDGICRGGSKVSVVNGEKIWWEYRRINDDGYFACVTSPERADQISLEYNRGGKIELDDSHKTHPAIERIKSDEAKLFGEMI